MKAATVALIAGLALVACEDDRGAAPTQPEQTGAETPAVAEVAPVLEEGAAPCPCWTARSLAATFPSASFFFTDLAPGRAAGSAALQLSDIANARVLQALAEFDPHSDMVGGNWCQVASFGRGGLESESISAYEISAEEFDSCIRLLEHTAEGAGLDASAD